MSAGRDRAVFFLQGLGESRPNDLGSRGVSAGDVIFIFILAVVDPLVQCGA